MGNAMKQLMTIWSKLGLNQKVTIAVVVLGVIGGIVALVQISRRPSYELLYSDLEEKDMAEVVAYLRDSKIPYQITAGGRAVMVPEGRKYDMRIGLAEKGVMPGHVVGLELWEAPGWGSSPLAEQMMKRRAIQGELARTIQHIEQVAWADVQVAQSEPSLFAEEERPTTAAITLKMHAGRSLTASQVAGICRLVAGSIEGLKSDNVTVIDEQGNLLSTARGDTASAAAADAQNFRRAYEDYMASKAQAMLDRALGAGRSVVKVSATLDLDTINQTKEAYDPAGRVAQTEKIQSKSTTGEGAGSEETNEASYAVPRSVTTTQSAPGTVKRLDVALIVDPEYKDKDDKDATLSAKQLTDLEMLVKRAVGFDEARKDSFQLTAMPFRRAPEAPAADPAVGKQQKQQFILQVTRNAGGALAVVVFVAFAGLALRRAARSSARTAAPAGVAPSLIESELMALSGGNGNGHSHLKNRVKDLMARDPAMAARMLQRWIRDEEKGKNG